jgi:hypothetical protein
MIVVMCKDLIDFLLQIIYFSVNSVYGTMLVINGTENKWCISFLCYFPGVSCEVKKNANK